MPTKGVPLVGTFFMRVFFSFFGPVGQKNLKIGSIFWKNGLKMAKKGHFPRNAVTGPKKGLKIGEIGLKRPKRG